MKHRFREATLVLAALFCVELAWAFINPSSSLGWLAESVALFAVLIALAWIYLEVPRLLPEGGGAWAGPARTCGNAFGILAGAALLLVLQQELWLYDQVLLRAPIDAWVAILVGLGILALAALAIRSSLRPLPEAVSAAASLNRTWLVYAAEILLALLVIHVRLNRPSVFGPQGARLWPFAVMAVAFAGVGLGELFRRRGLAVLAEPLYRTGLFLPLLPLLVFWLKPPETVVAAVAQEAPGISPVVAPLQALPQEFSSYALLWLLTGLLLSWVALARQSFRMALLAALSVNFALWSLFAHTGIRFLIHPQLWLIPLALIILVSEHLNRRRLRQEQSVALRYLGLGMIYLSSTADMFITGVGNSVWLPLVLAVLSVGGVLAGIVLRVRAFLFLGLAFLILNIFSMIWHAAVDQTQTWIWYVSGIILGAIILALFAVFEKRRNDVLRLIEEVKRWD